MFLHIDDFSFKTIKVWKALHKTIHNALKIGNLGVLVVMTLLPFWGRSHVQIGLILGCFLAAENWPT
jgi:hypothetical protein